MHVDAVPSGSTENTRFDQNASLEGVAKWYGYIDQPERVPEFMRRAFTMLRSGRPGPVVLGIPNASATYERHKTLHISKRMAESPGPC
ncbi:MAG: hypothetical protein CM1200mP39_11890 [Dehalococcoidia bacterium]|nr:MAG: hypothetical protein CM1200mP39_11890 [Dehalococcoidia bacterium]